MTKLIVINNSCKDSSSLPSERLLFTVRPPTLKKKKRSAKRRQREAETKPEVVTSPLYGWCIILALHTSSVAVMHLSYGNCLNPSTKKEKQKKLLPFNFCALKRNCWVWFYFETTKISGSCLSMATLTFLCGDNGHICMKETQEESTVILLTLGCRSRSYISVTLRGVACVLKRQWLCHWAFG